MALLTQQDDLIRLTELQNGRLKSENFSPKPPVSGWREFTEIVHDPMQLYQWSGFNSILIKSVEVETNLHFARLACFLERYRISHGHYPDHLNEIPDLPSGLDQEIVVEQPIQYHREGNSYRLYSVGWNRTDAGGKVAYKARDWVWVGP